MFISSPWERQATAWFYPGNSRKRHMNSVKARGNNNKPNFGFLKVTESGLWRGPETLTD